MQKISTMLWFDGRAEEAAKFYVSVFKNSKMGKVVRYGDAGPGPKGNVMIASFELEGREYTALNGGPQFKFNESVSFIVHCKTQEEVDYYWDKLLAGGGQESMCGWLKDKFGLSWQITPDVLLELISDPDPAISQSVMKAMMQMRKIDIEAVKRAKKAARAS
jgi:predicted 3-demethylubiquinone-9 3-methyltransferase (glyoxalase superfamily)